MTRESRWSPLHAIFNAVVLLALLTFPAVTIWAQTPWRLVWHDEFSGSRNTPPDSSKWVSETGGGGWGNAELEVYTNSSENASLDGSGNLMCDPDRLWRIQFGPPQN